MKYRHEWKHEIDYADMLALRQRLSAVAKKDAHTIDGKYEVRSLYFDNINDKVLREKIDGVNIREKFRIRYYNGDSSAIKLEKKCKVNGLCLKDSASLTKAQAQAIVDGDYSWMMESGVPLIEELYTKIMKQGLRPKTIVDYTREPFVFAPGNVRVTLDYNIRTGLLCTDFLNPESITVSVGNISAGNFSAGNISCGNATIILEVKWDEYLPDIIRDAVQLNHCRVGTFSKYAVCRIYG